MKHCVFGDVDVMLFVSFFSFNFDLSLANKIRLIKYPGELTFSLTLQEVQTDRV